MIKQSDLGRGKPGLPQGAILSSEAPLGRKGRREAAIAARFAVLRTRLLQEMSRQSAKRLGVCSISKGAGASYVAANLALATSRLPSFNVLLVDLALRHSSIAAHLGVSGDQRFETYLRGEGGEPDEFTVQVEAEGTLSCIAPERPIEHGAELLQDGHTRKRISALVDETDCNLAIFDLSPVLGTDEGLAALPMMDAVLLVADGLSSTGQQVADCQRLMVDMPPLVGVVLNKAEILG